MNALLAKSFFDLRFNKVLEVIAILMDPGFWHRFGCSIVRVWRLWGMRRVGERSLDGVTVWFEGIWYLYAATLR